MTRLLPVALTSLLMSVPAFAQTEGNLFEKAPWNVSLGLGQINFEGDEEVEDGTSIALKIGYDLNSRWTIEGNFSYMPTLDARRGENPNRARLPEGIDSISAFRAAGNVLYHLRNVEDLRFDPFLSLGAGFISIALNW